MLRISTFALSLGGWLLVAHAQEDGLAGKTPWNEAEFTFTAKLESAQVGPVANSFPPIYTYTLKLTVDKSLRGGLKAGENITAGYSIRTQNRPTLPVERPVLVAASKSRGNMSISRIEEYDDKQLAAAEKACKLPLGWKQSGEKTLSPWSKLGKKGWAVETALKSDVVCSETGRPALFAGGVTLSVEHVPSAKDVQFANPDGDGEYKITVKNESDKPVEVPALLSRGKEILWDESLVILCQGKAYPCPNSAGVSGAVTATTLKAGESVATTVNALALDGPEWPMGGYRIEFQFSLGEQSVRKSFYYLSKHHDPIRASLKKPKS